MNRICRLIHNFAGGMLEGTLWRLCASSRLANHRSVFHSCQQFQEKDNLFSKGVNVSSKLSTNSGNRLSTTSEKNNKLSTKIRKRLSCPEKR